MSQQNALTDNTEVVGRQMIDDRTSNLFGAASGSGYGHQSCPAGVPVELALLSLLAAFGVATTRRSEECKLVRQLLN